VGLKHGQGTVDVFVHLSSSTMALGGQQSLSMAFLPSNTVRSPRINLLCQRPTSHLGDRLGCVTSSVGSTCSPGGRLYGGLLASTVAAGAGLASRQRPVRRGRAQHRGRSFMQRSGFLLGRVLEGREALEDDEESVTMADLQQKWGLHSLTDADLEQLQSGLPVQKQERDGPTGSGLVVFEVHAPPSLVAECLESFEHYQEMIPVVRQAEVVSRTPMTQGIMLARLKYRISKFWLNLSVVHRVDRTKGTIQFDLDESCSKVVVQQASGFWQVEQAPGGHPSKTRIWLRATLRASSLLPHWIIDYAAARALRRATAWLKPHTESLWWNRLLDRLRKEDWAEDDRFKVAFPSSFQLLPSMA